MFISMVRSKKSKQKKKCSKKISEMICKMPENFDKKNTQRGQEKI